MIVGNKQHVFKIDDKTFHCGTAITMSFIGGKWKCVILWYLRNGTMRFSEIRKLIPDITDKMLSIQLKALEDHKLLRRKVTGVKPPLKVQYSLTKTGKSLIPILKEMTNWGINYGQKNGEIIEFT